MDEPAAPQDLDNCLEKRSHLEEQTADLKEENENLRQGARDFKALAERLYERLIVEGRPTDDG